MMNCHLFIPFIALHA